MPMARCASFFPVNIRGYRGKRAIIEEEPARLPAIFFLAYRAGKSIPSHFKDIKGENAVSKRQQALRKATLFLVTCLVLAAGLSARIARAAIAPENVPFVDRQVVTATGTYDYQV